MYEVYIKNGNEIKILHELSSESDSRLAEGKFSEEINAIPSFTFKILPFNPCYNDLHDRKTAVEIVNTLTHETEFEGILLNSAEEMTSKGTVYKTCVCEGCLGFLCDSIQNYHHYENATVAEFLTALLAYHNSLVPAEKQITLGLCDFSGDNTNSKTTAYRNTLAEIKENLQGRIGGEIRIRRANGSLVLDYLTSSNVNSSTTIELAKNIKSLEVSSDSSNVITRLIPLGCQLNDDSAERLTIASVNDGRIYIDDSNAIEKYGIIVGTAEFDDITLPQNLKQRGQAYLANNNRAKKAYKAQVLDLSVLDPSEQAIHAGYTYHFKNSLLDIDDDLRLIKRTVDIYKPYAPEVEIGDKFERITDLSVRTAHLIEYEMPQQKIDILASAKATATALITTGITGYVVVNGNEILIMDTPDKATATKVWRWNSGGFGYSSTGYNGTYGTAITMNGAIVADFITAGVLRGIEILNGNGTFHVDENGNVTASAFTMTGGRIDMTTNSQSYDAINLNFENQNNELWSSQLSPLQLDLRNTGIDKRLLVQAGGIFLYSGGTAITQINDGNISASGNISAAGNVTATGNISATGNVYADELKFKLNGNVYDTGSIIATLWNEVFGGGM